MNEYPWIVILGAALTFALGIGIIAKRHVISEATNSVHGAAFGESGRRAMKHLSPRYVAAIGVFVVALGVVVCVALALRAFQDFG